MRYEDKHIKGIEKPLQFFTSEQTTKLWSKTKTKGKRVSINKVLSSHNNDQKFARVPNGEYESISTPTYKRFQYLFSNPLFHCVANQVPSYSSVS